MIHLDIGKDQYTQKQFSPFLEEGLLLVDNISSVSHSYGFIRMYLLISSQSLGNWKNIVLKWSKSLTCLVNIILFSGWFISCKTCVCFFAMVLEKYANFIEANRIGDPVERLKALKRLVRYI